MYDYLIVGAGLFGAVFAHEAALKGKKVKVIENEIISRVISILVKRKEFKFISMVLIFSILLIRRFGIRKKVMSLIIQ